MEAKKRFFSLLLAVCLVAGLMPTAVFAAGTDTGKAIQLGTSGISGYDSAAVYDYIYFGSWTPQDTYTTSGPIKWRVLDDQTNTGETGLFLLSDALLGTGSRGDVYFKQDRTSNAWQSSDAQVWCNTFATNNLDSRELAAILETTKSDTAFTSSANNISYAASENILNKDKVFFLSAEEAENSAYGFTDDNARIANYGNSVGVWWLRSPYAYTPYSAGAVNLDGHVSYYSVHYDWAARPAFNLDLKSVLFTSAAVGGKSASGMDAGLTAVDDDDGSDWKLTLFDDQREFSISVAEREGDTVDFSYSGAQTGKNEYISAVITGNGELTHYGRILQLDGTKNGPSGTASITLPAGVTLSDTVKLYVFNEQYNGGENDDTKLTDYASQLQEVTFDTTAPELTAGTATRDSETSAAVTFTSDEAGTCYYAVVDRGATAPTIDTTGTGTPCAAGKNTVSLNDLMPGAKDLYIVVKDAAGNESEMLKVEIPASALAAPQNPVLTGTAPGQAAAAWDAVANASGYSVQLYKYGAPQGEPMKVQGTDCTFAITEAGNYTFTVTALGTEGQYQDSEASGPSGPLPFYEISFAEGGIPAQYVPQGGQAAEPSAPAKEGYTFGGWYTDSALTTAWDFENDRVTRSMTLYAKWATVPAAGGSGTSGTSEAPAATPAPQDDAAYYTCPACGYHNWTATADGYRCDHCGNIVTAQLSGYGNVKGAWDPAAAAASGAAYSGPIPATGDEADPALWAAVCGLSALALLALAAYRRKRL